jgi:hypothetical protein
MSPPIAPAVASAPPAPAAAASSTPLAAGATGAPGCPQCAQLLAERNRYRTALTEMACTVGWPIDREAHLRELQQLAHQTLGMSWDRPFREPTPVLARLAYGKQPGAGSPRRGPAWLRGITRAMKALPRRLKRLV